MLKVVLKHIHGIDEELVYSKAAEIALLTGCRSVTHTTQQQLGHANAILINKRQNNEDLGY